jgi:hypothetical protein
MGYDEVHEIKTIDGESECSFERLEREKITHLHWLRNGVEVTGVEGGGCTKRD